MAWHPKEFHFRLSSEWIDVSDAKKSSNDKVNPLLYSQFPPLCNGSAKYACIHIQYNVNFMEPPELLSCTGSRNQTREAGVDFHQCWY